MLAMPDQWRPLLMSDYEKHSRSGAVGYLYKEHNRGKVEGRETLLLR
jgi:hypothetical protein